MTNKRIIDVDTTDRADGKVPVWDTASGTHVYVSASGSVAADTLWDAAGDLAVGSGANTAARLAKGAAGANLSTYNGTVSWNGGTSFPASPATGDRYWRSDLGVECRYDGTRWLGPEQHVALADGNTSISATGRLGSTPMPTSYDLYVYRLELASFVQTTNNGTSFWTMQLVGYDVTNATATGIGSTAATSSDTASNWINHGISIGAVVTRGTSYRFLALQGTKTSAPGTLFATAAVVYSLIYT